MTAYLRQSVSDFLEFNNESILGELARHQTGLTPAQLKSWEKQIPILKRAFEALTFALPDSMGWGVLVEYRLLRLQKRIDVVLLANDIIVVVEFKVGAKNFEAADIRQAEDYALDLRDFHSASTGRSIVPILCCTEGPTSQNSIVLLEAVADVVLCNSDNLASNIENIVDCLSERQNLPISLSEWEHAAYSPVPSVIEAAELLYSAHNVAEVHAALADQKNLTETTDHLADIIRNAKNTNRHVVCFVTGVPGSGKTLIGLNAIHDQRFGQEVNSAGAFLSGNSPLVAVLREALAQDHKKRLGGRIADARRTLKTKIQLLMRFLEEYTQRDTDRPPVDHIIVFDEAQRAWDAAYGKQKFDRDASEPTLLLEIMAKHKDWAVIVALVGGGQEINKGEGGLAEWGRAFEIIDDENADTGRWHIHAASHAIDGSSVTAGTTLFDNDIPKTIDLVRDERLHLPVSIRSHRCELANAWIDAVLLGKKARAATIANEIDHFPIYLTRSLETMREWLSLTTRGNRRCGLVASSGARRLRGYGLGSTLSTQDLDGIKHWFLKPREDVRSSYALETSATEYACQGLELDRVGLCWDGDMTWSSKVSKWDYRRFSGTNWQRPTKPEAIENIKNTYRVLMSRAREALVIWVPPGEETDRTRPEKWMNETAEYFSDCGIRSLRPG